jgi:hypothetical protein
VRPHDVAPPFFVGWGERDEDQIAVPVVAREFAGVVAIVFALVPGALRGQRRRADVTVVAPARQSPLEHIPAPAGFIHAPERGAVKREAPAVLLESREVVRHGVDLAGLVVVGAHDRTHDGVLVHIKAEKEIRRGGGTREGR